MRPGAKDEMPEGSGWARPWAQEKSHLTVKTNANA